jgi:protease YdgD
LPVLRALAGWIGLLLLSASLMTPRPGGASTGSMTIPQASEALAALGITTKPSSNKDELEVIWIDGKEPLKGYIVFNFDSHGQVNSVDPVAPIPADRIRYLSRAALHDFALRWNSRNAGEPEYLDVARSGILYLSVMVPRASAHYEVTFFKQQIQSFRAALDRALDDLDRESKANEPEGDKAYASDWKLADPKQLPARAVGRLEVQGGYLCTATLVADDIILTAAHCIMDDKGRHRKPLVFYAGIDHGDAVAQAGIVAVLADPAFDPVHQFDGNSIANNPALARDWALLRLDSPIGRNTGTIEVFAATKAQLDDIVSDFNSDVIQIGYGGQGGHRPKLRHDCGPADVLDARYYTTQCGLVKGDSGSPLLLEENGKYRIIGINYAWVDLDYVNHVFLVVGSAAFNPSLRDMVSGKLKATSVTDWTKGPEDAEARGTMGQPFHQ